MITKTKYHSWSNWTLPKGCQLCVQGKKTVVFITGLCPRHCFYCPISDKKHQKDVIYINEWPTKSLKDLITECKLCSSEGVGITGGDPLCKLERTIKYIRTLKKTFGKKFHIHLYTSFDLVNENNLNKLYKAGLDEIRFHPEINNNKLWNRIEIARKFNWDLGIEIPVIPKKKKETEKLINFFGRKVDFLNLNELEYSDAMACELEFKDFKTKNQLSYGIKGSEKLAKDLLRKANKLKINTHYCTTTLKDRVQLANRIKLRAKNVAKHYDYIDSEGMLIRGAIYGSKKKILEVLKPFKVPKNLLEYDKKRKRMLTSTQVIEELTNILRQKKLKPCIVIEYPTYDCLNVMTDFI